MPPWTPDDPEWLEIARIELCMERARDESVPAEERIAAVDEYFGWLDREFPGLVRTLCLPHVPAAIRLIAELS